MHISCDGSKTMRSVGEKIWNLVEHIVKKVLKIICNILHKPFSEEIFNGLMQFIKFGIVGVSNVVVSYALYIVFLVLFQRLGIFKNVDFVIAQSVSFLLSVLWSFYWNNKMVFVQQEGEERSIWKALLKTYISYSFTGLVLNNVLLFIWVNIFHISEFVAPIINLLVSVPLNFIINKFWAFKGSQK